MFTYPSFRGRLFANAVDKVNIDKQINVFYTVWCRSEGNSFCGDVVFDSFNKTYRDTVNILDQIYEKQICSDFYHKDLDFYNISRLTYIRVALKHNFNSSMF